MADIKTLFGSSGTAFASLQVYAKEAQDLINNTPARPYVTPENKTTNPAYKSLPAFIGRIP
jgi:hypothetical protein